MNAARQWMIVAVLCVAGAPGAVAQDKPAPSLVGKQQTQQQVRAMARDLVAAILDIQLVQLDENGLTETELYRDIRAMRGHIDELIEAEMPRVIELLAQIEAASGDRDKSFVAVRQKSREILVQLLVERQRVLRRLRIAELAAQVGRLIDSQTKVLGVTESLPEQAPTQREALVLSALEDQRDVKAVYLRLQATVKDVATWGGEVGTLAAQAMAMLQKARVDVEMDGAAQTLDQTRFPDSAAHQKNVLKALRELLEILQRVQGLMNNDRSSIEQNIRELVDRQQEVRQATSQSDLSDRDVQQLVQEQGQIQKDVAELADKSRSAPESAQPLDEAKDAAAEATAKLFEAKRDEALAQQDRVLASLNKAAQAAQSPAAAESPPPMPAPTPQAISDLEAARQDLVKIQAEQKQASASAEGKPAEARTQENQIAQHLGEVPKDRKLPEEVTSRVGEARQAASDAGARMDQPQPERRQATRAAEQAIQRALSEVEQALADARRQQLRDAMNALAQAAETIEKAAAAEHQVAGQAQQAADKGGLQADQARELGEKQAGVQKTATEVGKRVEQAAPQPAKTLAEAAPPIQQAAEKLQAAEKQPGEPSKPAAQEAGKQADQAAAKLDQAAAELHREAARAAERLARLTNEQLQQAEQALETVDKAAANRPKSLGERIARLAQAEEHVRKAEAEQKVAAGRPEPAAKPDTPPAKPDMAAQARVGQETEAAKELAEPDAPQAAETLAEAGKSSEEAQQQAPPQGNAEQLAKAQQSTAESLHKAAEQIAEAKKRLAEQAAQEMAKQSQAAVDLANQATPVDPGATGALHSAENQAGQAAQELPKSPSAAQPAEQGVGEAMDRAVADLAARVRELMGDQALAQAVAAQAAAPQTAGEAGAKPAPQPSDQASPQASQGGTSRKGEVVQNQAPNAKPVQSATPDPKADSRGSVAVGQDADAARQRQTEEPWFAQLPPEVRAAIRANAQRRPPRGYEERLQKYFKNLD